MDSRTAGLHFQLRLWGILENERGGRGGEHNVKATTAWRDLMSQGLLMGTRDFLLNFITNVSRRCQLFLSGCSMREPRKINAAKQKIETCKILPIGFFLCDVLSVAIHSPPFSRKSN